MASLSFPHISSLPRWQSNWNSYRCLNLVQLQIIGSKRKWLLAAVPRKKSSEPLPPDGEDGEKSVGEEVVLEKKTRRRTSSRSKKNEVLQKQTDSISVDSAATDEDTLAISESAEDTKKTKTRTRRKAASTSSSLAEEVVEKKPVRRRRTKKQSSGIEDEGSETETSPLESDPFLASLVHDSDDEVEIEIEEGEDISYTYGWPPLVCCFGAAQHAFVPAGRRANRLIDHELREKRKELMWTPEKFVRAPGGSASNVAIALARLGGKVAFMGKVGDDNFGHSLVKFLNLNNVQTRSIRLDGKRATAVSEVKLGRRGGLRITNVKPCAEDCLSKTEINVDVLKEAKMFYFNTFSLLDQNMRSTTLHAIKMSRKLGGVVFYDLNLPLPLWKSSEDTKTFIWKAWKLADIIEITKQELEFLCGIEPLEQFDTKDNDRSKFNHYSSEVISQLWHENLKILFVTNGTSKIHYYTKEENGAVLGMEDPPLTPFTSEMSAAGDGVVAGIMRKLTVQPDLMTDKKYLEHSIKYAINCGIIDQWLQARSHGYPPKEGMEDDVPSDPNGIKSITEREYRTVVPADE
ncbi:carbohydrate kinase [Lithospermum erythrorhizon]|uniref:Carbohydrate kinase n=1 Tax=Lithospermum erythrorhizon TaxID=34254 RepID=A0AAV3QI29_LITER